MVLQDTFTVVFAGLTLLVTLSIAFLAIHLSSDLNSLRDGLRDLNARMDRTDQANKEFSFQAAMLLDVASDFYRTNSLLLAFFRRDLELQGRTASERKELYEYLISELAVRNKDAVENIDFLKVLVTMDSESVQTLVDKRPTRETLLFLTKLSRAAPASLDDFLRDTIEKLTLRILGISATKWTGMRL